MVFNSWRGYLKVLNNKGFTLVELLVVFVILGIVAAIAVLSVSGIIEDTQSAVCYVNRLELERWYERFLLLGNIDNFDPAFSMFLHGYGEEICPLDGVIRYVNGVVECSIHSIDKQDQFDDGGVPYL